MVDKQLEALRNEAIHMNQEASALRDDLESFSKLVKQGLMRGMLRGFVMVVIGIIFAVSILSYIGEPYACGTKTLIAQPHAVKTELCKLVFPATKQQIVIYKASIAAAKSEAERAAQSKANKAELDQMKAELDQLQGFIQSKGN